MQNRMETALLADFANFPKANRPAELAKSPFLAGYRAGKVPRGGGFPQGKLRIALLRPVRSSIIGSMTLSN